MTTDHYHIAIELIEAIGEYLDGQGFSADDFFRQQGFVPDSDDHEGYVDFQLFSRLFDAAEQFTGDHCIGLNVGAYFLARHWGRLGYLIMSGENGLEGVQYIQRFARIEVQEEPGRTFSSFVHGYTSLPVTVTRR